MCDQSSNDLKNIQEKPSGLVVSPSFVVCTSINLKNQQGIENINGDAARHFVFSGGEIRQNHLIKPVRKIKDLVVQTKKLQNNK